MEDFIKIVKNMDLKSCKSLEDFDSRLRENLNCSLDDLRMALESATIEKADALAGQFINIAPQGDWLNLLEDNSKKAHFLKTEASKFDHWFPSEILPVDGYLEFVFLNNSVDDGETFKGYVVISPDGKIKHAFAQAEEF